MRASSRELQRTVRNVGPDEWITGGDWSGAIQWMEGRGELEEKKETARWEPHRKTIDGITENNPCLLNSYDGELYLANTAALRAAGLEDAPFRGHEARQSTVHPRDLFYRNSPAIDKVKAVVQPKSEARILNEYRAGLKLMAEMGIRRDSRHGSELRGSRTLFNCRRPGN